MKANFGILPPLVKPPRERLDRNAAHAARSRQALETWLASLPPDDFQ